MAYEYWEGRIGELIKLEQWLNRGEREAKNHARISDAT